MQKKRKRKGFTLLEILLVIATIGILAAIVIVAINPNRQLGQVRTAAINSEKNQLEKAIQQRLIDTGSYPTGVDGVQRKICSSTVTADCINITTDLANYIAAIPIGGTYTVAIGNNGRVYVNPTETAGTLTCPSGYIRVPGNSLYNTKDFCVMKYEAKAVSISAPTVGLTTPDSGSNTISNTVTATTNANSRAIASVASGYPIANISQPTSASYCSTAGASLITNAEWMTIARNIEAQGSNWTGGTVGSGGLWRGHSDASPSAALVASTDNDPYNGTGNIAPSIEKRIHTLSNGEVIWDFSGNMIEWTNNTITAEKSPTVLANPVSAWLSFTDLTTNGTLSYDDYRPSNSGWNWNQNTGQIYSVGVPGNTTVYGFLRGGDWIGAFTTPNPTGIFMLGLATPPSWNATSSIGFRCVVR